jgi:hypothetical protein
MFRFFFAEHAMTRDSLLGHEGEIARAYYGSTGFRRHAFLKRRSDPSFPQGSDRHLKSHVSVEIDCQEHAYNLATSFALLYSPWFFFLGTSAILCTCYHWIPLCWNLLGGQELPLLSLTTCGLKRKSDIPRICWATHATLSYHLYISTIDHCGSRCKGWLGPPLTHTYQLYIVGHKKSIISPTQVVYIFIYAPFSSRAVLE